SSTRRMKVSTTTVVLDLDTTASGVQSAIAREALVSAAFILIGSKIADLVGRKRAYDPHRDLPELHGLERPAWSNTPVPRGSHRISSLWIPWLQPVAISGKSVCGAEAAETSQKTVAEACDHLPRVRVSRWPVDGADDSVDDDTSVSQ